MVAAIHPRRLSDIADESSRARLTVACCRLQERATGRRMTPPAIAAVARIAACHPAPVLDALGWRAAGESANGDVLFERKGGGDAHD